MLLTLGGQITAIPARERTGIIVFRLHKSRRFTDRVSTHKNSLLHLCLSSFTAEDPLQELVLHTTKKSSNTLSVR